MPRSSLAAAALVLGAAAASLGAAPPRASTPRPIAPWQTGPLRAVRLADGVYALLRHHDPRDPSDANSLVVVGPHDVIVVDANITPSSSRAAIAAIRAITPRPVRYVINTHGHSDHLYGNMAYADAYPGVEFVAHPMTRAAFLRDDPPALARNLQTVYPGEIARLDSALRRGTTRQGVAYTPAQRASLERSRRTYQWFLDEMREFRFEPPTLMVQDSLVLHRGSRRIVIRHPGRTHTAGDLVVHLPDDGIIATGDMVVAPVPFAWNAHPTEWARALRALHALRAPRGESALVIVPGHGPLLRDLRYTDLLAATFDTAVARVRAADAPGLPADSLRARVRLDDFRDRYLAGDTLWASSFPTFASALVGRAVDEVRGALDRP